MDSNDTTIALTGDNTKLIKFASTALITITAAALKGASIVSKVVNGTVVSGDTLSISNVANTPFTVTVTDSRGNTATVTLNPIVVAYIPLTISCNFYRPAPTTGEVAIEYSGNYFDDSFGAEVNSLILSWKYRLKGATDWTDGGALTPSLSGNTYSGSESLGTIFDYQSSFEFTLYYSDELTSSDTGALLVTKGKPIADWGESDFNINGILTVNGVDISVGGGSSILSGTTAQRPQATKTDEYTKLLLHLDTGFNDSCGNVLIIGGNTHIDTNVKKFGAGSAYFDGDGDYISIPHSINFEFGSGDFTIDGWFYFERNNVGYQYLYDGRNSSDGTGCLVYVDTNNHLFFLASGGSSWSLSIETTKIPDINSWHHIAVVRSGTAWAMYYDGVAIGTRTGSLTIGTVTQNPYIGCNKISPGAPFKGYIDEFRVSKGIARWSANFTPPAAASDWSGTSLTPGLMYYDTTIKKPIWSDGINWRDAMGTVL